MKSRPGFRHYSKEFINEVLSEVESGIPRWKACEKYGVPYVTLSDWISKYGSDDFLRMKKPSFTIHQRNSIVNSVLNGRMTIKEASVAHRVNPKTIKDWLRKRRKDNLDIEANDSSMSASNETDLQKALQAAQLKVLALETLIDIAEQEFKIKIRKKPGAKQ